MERKYMAKGSGLLAVLMASGLIMSGCAEKEAVPSASDKAPAASTSPAEISIMTTFTSSQPPETDNALIKEIEKQTNTKLNITWVSANNYVDKMNVTLSSGSLPDMMLVLNPTLSNVVTSAKQGAFWDVGPYVKDYPNLALTEDAWNNTKIEGKSYGIPRVRPLIGGDAFPIIRKDWLDKLGLKTPETMDDMYTVLKAFTENDPDGNGKKDTVGLLGFVNDNSMGMLAWVQDVFNGARDWKLQDGKVVPPDLLPGTKDALTWLAKAYKEGVLTPDFGVMKLSQMKEAAAAGKGGVFSESIQQAWLMTSELRKGGNSAADFIPIASLQASASKFGNRDAGHYGMYVISKKVPEAKLKQILTFIDKGFTQEVVDIAKYGFKDVHYTVKDGIKTATPEAAKEEAALNNLGGIFTNYDKYLRASSPGVPTDFYDRNKKIIDEREKVSIANPVTGLISDANVKFGPEIYKKTQDLKTKIIMGTEPLTAWDDYVNKLKADANYQKIISEMNEAYQKKAAK